METANTFRLISLFLDGIDETHSSGYVLNYFYLCLSDFNIARANRINITKSITFVSEMES